MSEDELKIENLIDATKFATIGMKVMVEINHKKLPLLKDIFIKYSTNEVILFIDE